MYSWSWSTTVLLLCHRAVEVSPTELHPYTWSLSSLHVPQPFQVLVATFLLSPSLRQLLSFHMWELVRVVFAWLISRNIMSRSIYVTANDIISFFLWLNNIALCLHMTSLSTHLPHTHLSSIAILTVKNRAAENMQVQVISLPYWVHFLWLYIR
jgi:phosphate starvation-inducible membrane PsiE